MVAMSKRTILSWIQDVLEVIGDYWFVQLQEKDLNNIVDNLINLNRFNLEQTYVENEINKYLIKLGYVYNVEAHVWEKE